MPSKRRSSNRGNPIKEPIKETPVEKTEEVIDTRPKKRLPAWGYTIKDGGHIYPVKLPVNQDQMDIVEHQVQNPRFWGKYHVHPLGGNRHYTQLVCFPPFEPIRVFSVVFPNGKIWNSGMRKFTNLPEE